MVGTLVEVGRALVYSSLALCAGFAVMLTSSFVGAIYFGLLTMLTIMVSLVSDLVFLPVLESFCTGIRTSCVCVVILTSVYRIASVPCESMMSKGSTPLFRLLDILRPCLSRMMPVK